MAAPWKKQNQSVYCVRLAYIYPSLQLHCNTHDESVAVSLPQGLTQRYSSLRDLAALAAQIPHHKLHPQHSVEGEEEEDWDGEEGGPIGYWSSPEDNVGCCCCGSIL